MASTGYHMQELPVTCDYSNLFDYCFGIASTNEDFSPLLESLGYVCPVSDSYSPYEEVSLCNISSLYEEDEGYPAITHDEQDQLSYNIWRNWDGEYESCFAYKDYEDANSFSYGGNYEHGSGLEKSENWFQTEEYGDNYVAYYDSSENQLSYDDCPWSACDSWLGYMRVEDSCYYDKKKTTDTWSYILDETELCEGIFGYRPCLIQKHM